MEAVADAQMGEPAAAKPSPVYHDELPSTGRAEEDMSGVIVGEEGAGGHGGSDCDAQGSSLAAITDDHGDPMTPQLWNWKDVRFP